MTIEWMQLWMIPIFWTLIDAIWLAVSILLFRTLGGKICLVLIAAASCSFLLSLFSTIDGFYGNIVGKPILAYESPLYFILFDIGWPFSLFCVAIFVGIATVQIHTIVRRNRELERLLPK